MKKNKTIAAVLGLSLAATMAFAGGTDGFRVKVGASNVSFDGESQSGVMIGMEKELKHNIYLGLAFSKVTDFTVTHFGLGGRYEIGKGFFLGANVDVMGVSLDGDNYSDSSYSGFSYGVDAKYEFNKNHSVFIDYKLGSVTAETGASDIDVDTTLIGYTYSF